MAPIMTLSHLG